MSYKNKVKFLYGDIVMAKFQNKYLEIKNIDKEIIDWIENIAEENNCKVERKEWKSKYNSYVVYDYEPFCSEGFEINLLFSSHDIAYLNFLKYLYNEKRTTIEYLNNCIRKTVSSKNLTHQKHV